MDYPEIFLICLWVLFFIIVVASFFINRSSSVKNNSENLNLLPFRNFTKTYYVVFSVSVLVLLVSIVVLSSLEYSQSSDMFIP